MNCSLRSFNSGERRIRGDWEKEQGIFEQSCAVNGHRVESRHDYSDEWDLRYVRLMVLPVTDKARRRIVPGQIRVDVDRGFVQVSWVS